MLVSSAVFFGAALPDPAPRDPPWNPTTRLRLRRHVQHDGVVRHQHELAVLRGRDDALELLSRWPAWRSRTSSRPPSASRSRSPSSARSRPARARSIGNFYSDLVKTLVYVLLPISIVFGLFLVSQGVIQSLTAGPVGSQEVIKELGTNGGGFFNVNSAHPFENPTWLSNFVELLLILAIPAALTSTYGRMVGNRRQGWAIYAAMMSLFLVAVVVVALAENGVDARHGRRRRPRLQHGGQGAALRRRLHRAVGRGHDRGLVRRRQRRDGVAHGPRRARPDGGDADRRGHLRRRRLRPLQHAAVRDPRRLPVRPDGRPHARVPGQEDRGARGQADRDRHDRRADARARSRARSRSPPSTARSRSSTPGRRAGPRRSTPTRRRPTTTARRSPATPASSSRPTPRSSASRSRTWSAAWR